MEIRLHKNIVIKSVTRENLEELRKLRNSPTVQDVLVIKGEISKSEQEKWFQSIDHELNLFFLVYIDNKPEGYSMLKNIDLKRRVGEPGIFLTDQKYFGSTTGALLTISFLDFCNAFFGIEFFTGNVLNTNKRALFNYSSFDTSKHQKENDEVILTGKKPYREMEKINKIRGMLEKLEDYKHIFTVWEPNGKHHIYLI